VSAFDSDSVEDRIEAKAFEKPKGLISIAEIVLSRRACVMIVNLTDSIEGVRRDGVLSA
jgi:hypothetical protein